MVFAILNPEKDVDTVVYLMTMIYDVVDYDDDVVVVVVVVDDDYDDVVDNDNHDDNYDDDVVDDDVFLLNEQHHNSNSSKLKISQNISYHNVFQNSFFT